MAGYGGASEVKWKDKDHTQEQDTPEDLVEGHFRSFPWYLPCNK